MEQGVIKRLRVKFIAINMGLALLILLITFGTVCVLDYTASVNTVNTHLSYVLNRVVSVTAQTQAPQVQGVQRLESTAVDKADISLLETEISSPSSSRSESGIETKENAQTDVEKTDDSVMSAKGGDATLSDADATDGQSGETPNDNLIGTGNTAAPPTIGSADSGANILTAVFKVEENGIYTAMPAYTTATLPENILLRADAEVLESGSNQGYLPRYDLRYEKVPTDGGWFVAYADASSTHGWRTLAGLLTIVGLIALVVFFLINLVFSNWALRPVARSIRQQQQFTADASHELKTPLTVILANLSILRSDASATVAEQMQWVESTETEARRMQLLVNDMLSLARPKDHKIEAAKAQELLKPVDLSDLVEGEVLQFESVAFDHGVLIESNIQEGIQVMGDAERLGRMVATLVDNACKYVDENGQVDVTLNVQPSKTMLEDEACLRVHNTGQPIPPEEQEHLFDRFYRADKARTGGKGGYGLGLAIGQQIAHEHNGEITIDSSASMGVTFIVKLPLYED